MPYFIVLLGPPGAGKGTQAQILSNSLGLPHISSGDIFRENIKNNTDLGQLAQSYISKGELVPDDLTISMIRDRLKRPDCVSGAILDGFPRTPAQADALEEMLQEFSGHVNAVPYITASEEELVVRLSGRWTCKAKGHIFNEHFNPPQVLGVCDVDGSELYQRDDDKSSTVTRRIEVYFQQTSPLIEYYRQVGKLVEINGARPISDVSDDLLAGIKKLDN